MLYDWNDDNLLTERSGAINYNDCSKGFIALNNREWNWWYLKVVLTFDYINEYFIDWMIIIDTIKQKRCYNNYIQFYSNTIYIDCWIDWYNNIYSKDYQLYYTPPQN